MNKQLSMKEVDELFSSVVDKPPVMSRRDKLLHWASLVRQHKSYFYIFHQLEYWGPDQLNRAIHPNSAFALAAADPKLSAAGMPKSGSALDVMKFFELSQRQLHEFSCDCGGEILPRDMADRIERLAG